MREEKLLEVDRATFLNWYEPSTEVVRVQTQESLNEVRLFRWAQKKARLNSPFYADPLRSDK